LKLTGLTSAIAYIILGTLTGLVINAFRPAGIPWIAEQLSTITDNGAVPESDSLLTGIHIINLDEAKTYFDQGIPFVDAREEEEYLEGHIPGAFMNRNFMELVFNLDTLQTREDLLVTYCDDIECGLSKNLAYDLQASGFTRILVFEGGWHLWKEAGYPVAEGQ